MQSYPRYTVLDLCSLNYHTKYYKYILLNIKFTIFCFPKGSKSVFRKSPIKAIVMEWIFKEKGESGPCPEAKVEELTHFLLSCKYVPFTWGIKKNSIVRLDTSKNGRDWFSNALIWLHLPSFSNHAWNDSNINISSV